MIFLSICIFEILEVLKSISFSITSDLKIVEFSIFWYKKKKRKKKKERERKRRDKERKSISHLKGVSRNFWTAFS